jgi:ATP-dependent exoDNAse (exonuclease V) beta subunit
MGRRRGYWRCGRESAPSCASKGIDDAGLDAASQQVETAIRQLLGDERGRWLFASDHIDARSEWALAGVDGDEIVHIVIDRTFVADGVRWIVDFKTGTHEGADSEAFLDRERLRYAPQLDRYARIVRALDRRPIRLGLYYPLQRGWREWGHSEANGD